MDIKERLKWLNINSHYGLYPRRNEMQFQVVIDDMSIIADGYIPIPKERAVQFYHNKSSLDYMPPIKVDANMLSDFGNLILCGKLDKEE